MNKREQDVLRQIEEKTEDVKVPDSLSPDEIRKMLEEKDKERKKESTAAVRRFGRPFRKTARIAAGLVVIAGLSAVIYYTGYKPDQESGKADEAVQNSKESGGTDDNTDSGADSIFKTADSYDQIYSYIEEYQKAWQRQSADEMYVQESAADDKIAASPAQGADAGGAYQTRSAADEGSAASPAQSGGNYSGTNVRQEGVDEGDIAKTDGRYLYVMRDGRQEISIVDTKDGLNEISTIESGGSRMAEEFYLNKDRKKLTVIYSEIQDVQEDFARMYNYDQSAVEAVVYDISDPARPEETGGVTQSGGYASSRMTGDYLYLISSKYIYTEIEKKDRSTYIPEVNGKSIPIDGIYLPPLKEACMYEVITAVDIQSPKEVTDSKAVYSVGGELYVSNENIYLYENTDGRPKDGKGTTIRKISYKDGRLKPEAQGKVKGYIHDSFCIDEYEGKLRTVTTVGDTNAVYVLDGDLTVIGALENLAKDERVYSARFMGEMGYFVTFRETDPLFSVDLSNPKKPEILGTLKIPGFSDYLHFYGEDRLLGIGMNVDEKTQVTDGVKLTMFDITDKADIKEADTYIMENVFSTNLSYDYKAALIDPEKNIIGFAADQSGGQYYNLFCYTEEEGFKNLMNKRINGSAMMPVRGIYIDQMLYVINGNVIESYSLESYEKIDDIIL